MDEEEQRKTEQSVGEKAQRTKKTYKQTSSVIRKIRQIIAVPILGKIFLILAAILIVAFVLVGVINFFQSMPNQTRDRLDEIIGLGVNWNEIDSSVTNANSGNSNSAQYTPPDDPSTNEDVLVSAAMDLISKGYDLEGYGFLDLSEGDAVEYTDDSEEKIESIKSKYLQAYIAANEATYHMTGGASTDFVVRYSEDLILQIVTEGDPTAWVDKDDYNYFLEIVEERVRDYLDDNDNIPMENLAQILAQTITDFNTNSLYMQIANSRGEKPQIRSVTEAEILAFMEQNLNVDFSEGMISVDGDGVNGVSIDRKNKQLVITVDGRIPSRDGAEATTGTHTYYYNLEGWLTKYARPYELLLTLHLATMAPEFAYEVATNPQTNAKVEIGVKQTSVDIDLVVDEKVAEAEGLEAPEVPTVEDLGIAQKGEISALEQCNTDMNFWYSQYHSSIYDLARGKAHELQEEVAKDMAEKLAEQAVKDYKNSCYDYYDIKDKEWKSTYSEAEANRIYNETHEKVYNAISTDKDLLNHIHDRASNWYHSFLGLIGVYCITALDVEESVVRFEGNETDISKSNPSISGADDKEVAFNNAYYELCKQIYTSKASAYNDVPLTKAIYSSIDIPGIGNVDVPLGDIAAPSMYFPIGGLDRNEGNMDKILEYLAANPATGTPWAEMLSEIAQIVINDPATSNSKKNQILEKPIDPETDGNDTNTWDMYNLGIESEELEHFIYIFFQIERLESLYKAIAALPSKVNFETHTPYIEQVTNHWFRNLTFRRLGTEDLEGFDAYSEDETRTNYQYYTRYFRWSLDPLITIYAKHPYGDPDRLYEQLGFEDCTQTQGYKYNVVELRYSGIEQIDNPRVTDNSAFIRSLITDEEYIIYDGEEKTAEQLSEDAKEPINISKISVNSYAALEAMPNETSEILVRNLKELFKNTNLSQDAKVEEFAETNTLKPLANIFPDYKPYTPWPCIWERFEEGGFTSMIYKNFNRADGQAEDGNRYHYLEAPTDGVVTSISDDKIEFAYRGVDGELYRLFVDIDLHEAKSVEIKELVEAGDTVTTGTNLLVMIVPNSLLNYQIQVNIGLVDNKGESLHVPDYMEVPQRELTAEEIIYLHNFIMNEAAGQGYWGQAAIAAVVFNRIKYPLMYASFVDCVDIFTTMDYTINPPGSKNGSWNEKDARTKLWGAERYPKIETSAYGGADSVTRSILMAIATASRGFDPTKGGQFSAVPLGATYYAIKDKEKGKYENKDYKIEIGNHVFYTEESKISQEDVFTSPYYEYEFRDDEDEWQHRFLLQLCITIKNSYYYENSEVLEDIIAWAVMEQEESARREEEKEAALHSQTGTEQY